MVIVATEVDRELANTLGRALSSVISRRVRGSKVIIDFLIIDIATDDTAREPDAIVATIPEWFVLLLATDSTESRAFDAAVERLTRDADPRRIMLAVSSGRLDWDDERNDFNDNSNAVPRSLRGRFDEMPYYLDLRWASGNPAAAGRAPRFESALAALAAPIVGLQKELVLRPRVRAGVITLVGLALVAPVAGITFLRHHNPSRTANRVTAASTRPATSTTPTTTPATATTTTVPTTTTTPRPCGGTDGVADVVNASPSAGEHNFDIVDLNTSQSDPSWASFQLIGKPGVSTQGAFGIVYCANNHWILNDIGTSDVGCHPGIDDASPEPPVAVRVEFKLGC